MATEMAEQLSVANDISRSGEDAQPPSKLGYANYGLCFVSTILFILDYVVNLVVFQKYFQLHKRHDRFEVYFYIIVGIILLPPIVTALFEIVWYKEEKIKYGKALRWHQWIFRIILMVLLLGPAFRYVEIVEHDRKAAKLKSLREKKEAARMSLRMKEDADFLYMLEKFTESGFHIVLQMFIVKVELAGDDHEEIGLEEATKIIIAVFLMPYSMTVYIYSQHQADETANAMGRASAAVQFLWRLFIIIPQAICLSFFLDVYPTEFVMTTVATYAFMAAWVFMEGTEFCRGRTWLECIFRFFVAFVYLFTFFNVSKEDTYHKAVFYHCFIFMERASMMCFWCYGEDDETWYRWPAMTIFFLLFAIGIAFQVTYYWFLHPSGSKVDGIHINLLDIKRGLAMATRAGVINGSLTLFPS